MHAHRKMPMVGTKQRWGFVLLAMLAISVGPANEAAAQSLGQVTAMNGVGTRAIGTSGGPSVQQPASAAPQLQGYGLSAQSTGSSAPASSLGQTASMHTTAVSPPQQFSAAPSQSGSAATGVAGQQAAVTGLTISAAQPMTSAASVPSQGSSATLSVPGQQPAATGGQSSADMQAVQHQVATTPYQDSATPAKQSAATSLSASLKAHSRQQASVEASEDTSLAAAPAEDGSKQQTLLKTAVLATRKSLDRDAPAPKTATQEAMQAQVSSAALQSDTLKASALAAEVSSAPQGAAPQAKQVVLLIHGGAQGGWVWSYPNEGAPEGVRGLLEDAGYLVYAPTLPYHAPNTAWSPNQGELKAQDYVDYLKAFMQQEAITGAVVVGHSVSGVWLQLLTVQAADRISRVVFLDAIVLKNGESFISNAVGPAQLFFTLVFTYPSFPQSLTLPTGLVDLEVWKNVMINLEGKTNETFAKDTYSRLVPEPAGPQLEYLDFTAFYDLPMPKFFLFEVDDVSLLSGNNARWLDFADRLSEANNGIGMAQTIKIRGDHQGMLTRPLSIAQGILEAATRPLVNT